MKRSPAPACGCRRFLTRFRDRTGPIIEGTVNELCAAGWHFSRLAVGWDRSPAVFITSDRHGRAELFQDEVRFRAGRQGDPWWEEAQVGFRRCVACQGMPTNQRRAMSKVGSTLRYYGRTGWVQPKLAKERGAFLEARRRPPPARIG